MDERDEELVRVCKDEEARLQSEIARALGQELRLFDEVLAGIRAATSAQDEQHRTLTRFQAVITGLFCKLILTCRSVRLLCASGNGIEGQVLFRSALEVLITMRFIGQTDHEDRAKLWAEFDHVLAWQYAEKAERWPTVFRQTDFADRKAVLRERYDKVKANYPDKYFWAGKLPPIGRLRSMAERVGLLWHYDFIYWSGSNQTHGNARSSREYVEKAEDGALSFRLAPSVDHSALPLESATEVMIKGFETFCAARSICEEQRIDEFVRKFVATYSRRLFQNEEKVA